MDYKKAGVNIDRANLFVKKIMPIAASTRSTNVLADIGPFAAFYSIKSFSYFKHPVLVSSTDGVGTKIKLCIQTGKLTVAGYDLVAMNVNDIMTTGARPLFFLDYFATSKLDIKQGEQIIKGIARGCRDSGMSLIGGETAELPGFYQERDFDLAGFALGIIDKSDIINGSNIKPKDLIIGLPSSGPHSNGYSLIRKLFTASEAQSARFKDILKPTKIYTKDILMLIGRGIKIKGMAHITGGGFYDNIERILPKGVCADLVKGSWPVQGVFKEIQARAGINDEKMYRTFNMGIGFILVLAEDEWPKINKIFKSLSQKAYLIGRIAKGKKEVRVSA
ncbi:MAG: phosphoribosylformylglycinamidine cyclo-ligase [Candidatus Omnitrophica bacterium]|nr:phosphoribosylformylglycinamidine cyclo-ligase [Candidatus Omnitrophota bacterium]